MSSYTGMRERLSKCHSYLRGLLKFDEFSHSLRVYGMHDVDEKKECGDAWSRCDERGVVHGGWAGSIYSHRSSIAAGARGVQRLSCPHGHPLRRTLQPLWSRFDCAGEVVARLDAASVVWYSQRAAIG